VTDLPETHSAADSAASEPPVVAVAEAAAQADPGPGDVQARLARAADLHRAGDIAGAEAGYVAVLADAPDNADALHLLGVVRRVQGKPDEAVQLMRRAIDLGAETDGVWANYANALRDAGDHEAEVAALDRALALGADPASLTSRLVAALVKAAETLGAAKRKTEALTLLQRAAKIRPKSADILDRMLPLLADADRLAGLEVADRSWRLAPDPTRQRNLWELCQWAGAEVAPTRAFLAAHPGRPLLGIAEANALRRDGQGAAAEAVYRRVIAAEPNQPFAAGRLAILLLSQGRTEEADRLFRTTDAFGPGRTEAMHFARAFHEDLARRPLPGLPEIVRAPSRVGDTVIFAGCDGSYFDRYASALIHSATVMSGIAPSFHLHVVDPPADIEDRIARWDDMLGNPGIALSVERVGADRFERETRITTYACARFRVLPALMAHYRRPILMLDTDLIVLRDIGDFVRGAREGDIAAVSVDHARFEPWNWYWADVMHFAATPAARTVAARVARYCDHFLEAGLARWFLDQIAITAALHVPLEDEPRVRVIRVPSDVHRLNIEIVDGRDNVPPETVLFWSAHASTVSSAYTLGVPRYADWLLS
jgi:tetratricopeptide (TPR) repeat protein